MITEEKMLWSFIKLSQLISQEMYKYQFGEFVCGYWGLRGTINAGLQYSTMHARNQNNLTLDI